MKLAIYLENDSNNTKIIYKIKGFLKKLGFDIIRICELDEKFVDKNQTSLFHFTKEPHLKKSFTINELHNGVN